jgi:hypothetical protein
MTSFQRRIAIIGVGASILSAVCFVRSKWVYNHTDWRPLVLPIQLVEGFHAEGDFSPVSPGDWDIDIRCRWTIPLSQPLLAKEISIDYDVREDGKEFDFWRWASGTQFSQWEGKFMAMELCNFKGSPGRLYHISVKVNRSSSVLASTEPELTVQLGGDVSKDRESDVWTVQFLGWATLAVAVCLFGTAVCIRGKKS